MTPVESLPGLLRRIPRGRQRTEERHKDTVIFYAVDEWKFYGEK